jgi:hypothetical protein
MHLRSALPLLALVSLNVVAEDWTATVGLLDRDTKFSLPANPYHSRSTTATATLVKKIDPFTFVGGNLAYSVGGTDASTNSSRIDTDSLAGAVFVMRSLGSGLLVDANLGYGNVALDNAYLSGVTRITYSADTNFLMTGVGITKTQALSTTLNGSLSARYTYIDSDNKGYVDSAGTIQAGTGRTSGFITLGGALNWRLGDWEPNTRLNWNVSDKEFSIGTGDKDYFSYSIGMGHPISPKTKVSVGYSGIAGKAYTKEEAFMLSVNTAF